MAINAEGFFRANFEVYSGLAPILQELNGPQIIDETYRVISSYVEGIGELKRMEPFLAGNQKPASIKEKDEVQAVLLGHKTNESQFTVGLEGVVALNDGEGLSESELARRIRGTCVVFIVGLRAEADKVSGIFEPHLLQSKARKVFEYGIDKTSLLEGYQVDPEWVARMGSMLLNGGPDVDMMRAFVENPPRGENNGQNS